MGNGPGSKKKHLDGLSGSDAAKRKTPRLVRALLIESVKSGTRTAEQRKGDDVMRQTHTRGGQASQ